MAYQASRTELQQYLVTKWNESPVWLFYVDEPGNDNRRENVDKFFSFQMRGKIHQIVLIFIFSKKISHFSKIPGRLASVKRDPDEKIRPSLLSNVVNPDTCFIIVHFF